jgi:hypothetical protein
MSGTASTSTSNGFDPSVLVREESKKLYAELPEPKALFGYLLLCLETPRPSSDLDRIRAKIAAIGKAHGFDLATDKAGNIRLRKPASDTKYANAVCNIVTSTHAFRPLHFTPRYRVSIAACVYPIAFGCGDNCD